MSQEEITTLKLLQAGLWTISEILNIKEGSTHFIVKAVQSILNELKGGLGNNLPHITCSLTFIDQCLLETVMILDAHPEICYVKRQKIIWEEKVHQEICKMSLQVGAELAKISQNAEDPSKIHENHQPEAILHHIELLKKLCQQSDAHSRMKRQLLHKATVEMVYSSTLPFKFNTLQKHFEMLLKSCEANEDDITEAKEKDLLTTYWSRLKDVEAHIHTLHVMRRL